MDREAGHAGRQRESARAHDESGEREREREREREVISRVVRREM